MQLARLFCPNKRCRDYKKKGTKNISIIGHYGKNQYRLLRCRICGFRFSERRLSIFFGLHTDEGTIKEALISLLGGKSIRKTAEEVGLDKDTVQRIWRRVVHQWEMAVEEFLEEINIKDTVFEDIVSFPSLVFGRGGLSKNQ